jgi:hypothetical protein
MYLDGVTFENSVDNESSGHGFFCSLCQTINIVNSVFRNLTALQAPAIKIQNQNNAEVNIIGSTFEKNHAQE